MEKLRTIIAAPSFENEGKSRSAYLLNFISISYVFIPISTVIPTFFVSMDLQKTMEELLNRSLPFLMILVISQILMRVGKVRTASYIFCILIWLTTTINIFQSGEVSLFILFSYVPVIMIFALLCGRVYTIASGISSLSVAIGVIILESQGILTTSSSAQKATIDIFIFLVVFFLFTTLLYLYQKWLDDYLEHLHQTNHSLELINADLNKQVIDQTRALEIFSKISSRLSTILDQQQLIREIVDQLHTAYGYYYAQIYLFDDFKQNLVMVGGTGDVGREILAQGHVLKNGQGLLGHVAERNQVELITDVSQAEGWVPYPFLPSTKTEVAVPIAIGQEVIGVLDVHHSEPQGLSQNESILIQSIANLVAIALRNAQTHSRSNHQVVRDAQITAINQRIQSAMTINDVLRIAVSELGEALGAKHSSIELINPNLQQNLD